LAATLPACSRTGLDVDATLYFDAGSSADSTSPPAATPDGADTAPPLAFTLSVSPSNLTLTQGMAGQTATVTVHRSSGFTGTIVVTVPTLPVGVTADSVTIPPGQTSAVLTFGADLAAPQGPQTSNVLGTPTADGSVTPGQAALALFIRGCSGCLDTTFGAPPGGVVAFRSTLVFEPAAVAIDPSGNILVAGTDFSAAGDATGGVARILADGSVDHTFGDHGVAHAPAIASYFTDVVVQPDGKTVASGQAPEFSVVRFLTNGAPDPMFGIQGTATPFVGQGVAYSLALRPDGRIVAAGATAARMTFSLAQLTTSGVLDPTFGTAGQVFTNSLSLGTGAMALQGDGRAVVVGGAIVVGGAMQYELSRFLANGSIDATYDANVAATAPFGGVSDVALQSDGKAVGPGGPGALRYTASGTLDSTFGMNGLAWLYELTQGHCGGGSLVVQPDDKIVFFGLAGYAKSLCLARLNPDGSLDGAFGTSGSVVVTYDPSDSLVAATDLALQADGRIVAVGYREANVGPELQIVPVVTRYWP
jgi:uncharacterized delta-60 repeat protein